jgi:membrane associated rhomboid family serine protease
MTNPIIEDLRLQFKSRNPISKIIIANALIFVFISLLRILLFVSGNSLFMFELNNFVVSNLTLPLSWSGLAHKPWTIITYMFTHIEFMHLFWNMLSWYWFARIFSEFTSSQKIIPLYLMGGIAGAIVTLFLTESVPAFYLLRNAPMLGASASVTAIIIATAFLVPHYKINLLFVGAVKLMYVALFVVFIDVLNLASYNNIGGNMAHLGGALMGYIFTFYYKKGKDITKPLQSISAKLKKLFMRKAPMKVSYKRTKTDEEYNYQKKEMQARVDTILDKISKSGYASLTKEEKDILFKASNKL